MMIFLNFSGILSCNDPPKSPESLPGQGGIDVHGKLKNRDRFFWISHGIGRDLEFSLGGTQGREEVENVEINLMMEKSGRGFCSGICSGWDTCTVFSGCAGIRSDFR